MFKPLVVLSALVVGSASFAHADMITGSFSVGGTDSYTPTTISFTNSTVQGALFGTFATYLHDGDAVNFELASLPYNLGLNTPPTSVYPAGFVPLFMVADATSGETFTFNMTQYDAAQSNGVPSCPGTCLDLTAFGYFTATGPANLTPSSPGSYPANPTFATTTLQYAAISLEGTSTTYSGQVIAPTPEPSSLALLGTGMLGAVGLARRKFKV